MNKKKGVKCKWVKLKLKIFLFDLKKKNFSPFSNINYLKYHKEPELLKHFIFPSYSFQTLQWHICIVAVCESEKKFGIKNLRRFVRTKHSTKLFYMLLNKRPCLAIINRWKMITFSSQKPEVSKEWKKPKNNHYKWK